MMSKIEKPNKEYSFNDDYTINLRIEELNYELELRGARVSGTKRNKVLALREMLNKEEEEGVVSPKHSSHIFRSAQEIQNCSLIYLSITSVLEHAMKINDTLSIQESKHRLFHLIQRLQRIVPISETEVEAIESLGKCTQHVSNKLGVHLGQSQSIEFEQTNQLQHSKYVSAEGAVGPQISDEYLTTTDFPPRESLVDITQLSQEEQLAIEDEININNVLNPRARDFRPSSEASKRSSEKSKFSYGNVIPLLPNPEILERGFGHPEIKNTLSSENIQPGISQSPINNQKTNTIGMLNNIRASNTDDDYVKIITQAFRNMVPQRRHEQPSNSQTINANIQKPSNGGYSSNLLRPSDVNHETDSQQYDMVHRIGNLEQVMSQMLSDIRGLANQNYNHNNQPVPSNFPPHYNNRNHSNQNSSINSPDSPIQPMANYNNNNFRNRKSVPVNQWKLNFTGENRGIHLLDFLNQIEMYQRSENISDPEMVLSIVHLLSGRARLWYQSIMAYTKTWTELVNEMKREFLPIDYDYQLLCDIANRTQRPNENFGEYITHMKALFRCLAQPITESHQLYFLQKNLLPKYSLAIAPLGLHTIDALSEACRRIDSVTNFNNQRSGNNLPFQTYSNFQRRYDHNYRSVNEIEELTEANDAEIAAIDRNNIQRNKSKMVNGNPFRTTTIKCWNCSTSGHSFNDCLKPRTGIFCFKCGTRDVISNNCRRCSGNAQMNSKKGEESDSEEQQPQ